MFKWAKFKTNIGVGSPVRELPTTRSDLYYVKIKTMADFKKVFKKKD